MENKQHCQTIAGQESKIDRLEDKIENLQNKYESLFNLKELYEGIVSPIMCPPMRITDTITFGKYKKLANEDSPIELVKFLEHSGLKDKLTNLGEDFVSMIEHMDDLKITFEKIKMIPDKPIKIDPTNITIRKVDLDDRILQRFHEAFISGSHAHLLNQQIQESDNDNIGRRRKIGNKRGAKGNIRGKQKGKGKTNDDGIFTKNEIEERKQEIKEISEEITDNMKYFAESKYEIQLK